MQLFTNNASSVLAAGITNVATSLSVASGAGAKFPVLTGSDYFLLTLYQLSGATEINHEIVKVTARTADAMTIVRAQEGTTAQAFNAADPVSLRFTANSVKNIQDMLGGNNLIVNGSCQIDQVNSGALITPLTGGYPIDNCLFTASQASKIQSQQVTDTLLSLGSTHALKISVLASYAPAASESFTNTFKIEGLNFSHLQWGTANAKAISIQFKARASVAGTYSGVIKNAANNRCYPFSFSLPSNTDTLIKVENIPGDTTGTWPTDNQAALQVVFDLGSNANMKGAEGAWSATGYTGVTGSICFVSQVNSSTYSVSDVQIETGAVCTQFERKLYDRVLRECKRYYRSSANYMTVTRAAVASQFYPIVFDSPMRTTPSAGYSGFVDNDGSGATGLSFYNLTANGAGGYSVTGTIALGARLLITSTLSARL